MYRRTVRGESENQNQQIFNRLILQCFFKKNNTFPVWQMLGTHAKLQRIRGREHFGKSGDAKVYFSLSLRIFRISDRDLQTGASKGYRISDFRFQIYYLRWVVVGKGYLGNLNFQNRVNPQGAAWGLNVGRGGDNSV